MVDGGIWRGPWRRGKWGRIVNFGRRWRGNCPSSRARVPDRLGESLRALGIVRSDRFSWPPPRRKTRRSWTSHWRRSLGGTTGRRAAVVGGPSCRQILESQRAPFSHWSEGRKGGASEAPDLGGSAISPPEQHGGPGGDLMRVCAANFFCKRARRPAHSARGSHVTGHT